MGNSGSKAIRKFPKLQPNLGSSLPKEQSFSRDRNSNKKLVEENVYKPPPPEPTLEEQRELFQNLKKFNLPVENVNDLSAKDKNKPASMITILKNRQSSETNDQAAEVAQVFDRDTKLSSIEPTQLRDLLAKAYLPLDLRPDVKELANEFRLDVETIETLIKYLEPPTISNKV